MMRLKGHSSPYPWFSLHGVPIDRTYGENRCLTEALLHRDMNISLTIPDDRLCPPVSLYAIKSGSSRKKV